MKFNHVHLLTIHVVGINYAPHQHVKAIRNAPHKAEVQLVREPQNPHDENAVRCDFDGHKIGYLPSTHVRPVAALLDVGVEIRAFFAGCDQRGYITLVIEGAIPAAV